MELASGWDQRREKNSPIEIVKRNVMNGKKYFFEENEFTIDFSKITDDEVKALAEWFHKVVSDFLEEQNGFWAFFEILEDLVLSEVMLRGAKLGREVVKADLSDILLSFDTFELLALRSIAGKLSFEIYSRHYFGEALLEMFDVIDENSELG
jgi:hypothetical protein